MTPSQPRKRGTPRAKAVSHLDAVLTPAARHDGVGTDVVRVLCHVLLARWADRHGNSIDPQELSSLFADWSEDDAGRIDQALESISTAASYRRPLTAPVPPGAADEAALMRINPKVPTQPGIPDGAKPILRAAAEVFLELGYSASLDQIATAANVTKPTIYSYFKDKKDLFRAAMIDVAEGIAPHIDPPDVTGDLRGELMRYARSFRAMILCDRTLQIYRTALINLRDMPDIGFLLARKTMVQTNFSLKSFFVKAIEAGLIKSVDPDILSEFFFAAASGQARTRLLMGLDPEPPETEENYLTIVVDSFLYGVLLEPKRAVRPPPPPRRAPKRNR